MYNELFEEIRKLNIKEFGYNPSFVLTSKLNKKRYLAQVKECSKLFKKNSKLLDMGCGYGYTTCILSKMRPDMIITGIDVDYGFFWKKLSKRFKCEFDKQDALKTNFRSNSFDGIISFGVIEHVGKRKGKEKTYLKEANRVLKKNGILYLCNLPNKYSMNEFLSKVFRIKGHDNKYTKKEIEDLFKKAGFEIEVIRRELLLPAQVNRLSKSLNNFFNKHYKNIDKLDKFLVKTPMSFFSQVFAIIAIKK
jgi:ubiquinone/menaquinone biosynthesis C-methylase UbiE